MGKRGAPGFFLGGGVLLGGWMRQRTRLGKRRREFWRAATRILAGGRAAARPCVCYGGRFWKRWLGSIAAAKYTQNLMALIASPVIHCPLAEAHYLKPDCFQA